MVSCRSPSVIHTSVPVGLEDVRLRERLGVEEDIGASREQGLQDLCLKRALSGAPCEW